jgi:Domain of unknown function (DUF4440)
MNRDDEDLRKLNRETFAAEDHASRSETAPWLDDTFKIARSTWVVQDKEPYLEQVAKDTSRRTREIDEEVIRIWSDTSVVTCRVTLREAGGALVGYFWNTKVCHRREGRWTCTAWLVARL